MLLGYLPEQARGLGRAFFYLSRRGTTARMFPRRLGLALGASLVSGASALRVARTRPATVPLASSVCNPLLPTTVLVHGLDSSKETWSGVLAELTSRGYPAMALDLRGHGESPFGPPDDFSAETLARDVWDAVAAHGVRGPVVLVGHSMGGRVAMRAATLPEAAGRERHQGAPPYLAAVVIEDMDLRVRQTAEELALAPTDAAGREALASFTRDEGRRFPTFTAAKQALLAFYPGEGKRVDSWEGKRVRPTAAGGWWSDINPAAQHLARELGWG